MEKLNDDYKYLFDDRELDDLEDVEIEIDEEFEKEMEEKYFDIQKPKYKKPCGSGKK